MYLTKSPLRAPVPEYWMLISSPWSAHTEKNIKGYVSIRQKTVKLKQKEEELHHKHMSSFYRPVYLTPQTSCVNQAQEFQGNQIWVHTEFKFLLQALKLCDGIVLLKNSNSLQLNLESFASKQALHIGQFQGCEHMLVNEKGC